MNHFTRFILLATLSCLSLSSYSRNINIEISSSDRSFLESNPYTDEFVLATVTIDTVQYDSVGVHYRGAWMLYMMMNNYYMSQRNWKLKFPEDNKFNGHQEWNLNYQMGGSEYEAYSVFRDADVPVVSTEFVSLSINNSLNGTYLLYEDPDNKTWLKATFGDNDGDLYKAATDIPYQPVAFADLTYLGDSSYNYYNHYRKQGTDDGDYSSIRKFTSVINHTPDEDFEKTILKHFDVAEFIRYLVVSNFIANWDSYPCRPKNYFLYHNPDDDKWHYIPWDLDHTFELTAERSSFTTNSSIFHNFDQHEPYDMVSGETTERPLVRRLMSFPIFRDKYCYEYRLALDTYLSEDSIGSSSFISARRASVTAELDSNFVSEDPFIRTNDYSALMPTEIFYNPLDSMIDTTLIEEGKSFEFIEFKNTDEIYSIDLSGIHLGAAIDFTFPDTCVLGPQEYFVVAAKPSHFLDRFGVEPSGNFSGNLSNKGEQIILYDHFNVPILDFTYDDKLPWPEAADGEGYSLVAVEDNPTGNPNDVSYWAKSTLIHGNPFMSETESIVTPINALSQQKSANIYPNPSNGIFNISQEVAAGQYRTYSLTGILCQSGWLEKGDNVINLSHLDKGIYLIEVLNENGTHIEQIIIK